MGNGKVSSLVHLHVAIPVMDELDYLPFTLQAIERQITTFPYTVYLCINQPDGWWDIEEKRSICEANQQLLERVKEWQSLPLTIIDYSSRGRGWKGRKYGVGQARKVLFDEVMMHGSDKDVLISLDADTLFSPHYFQAIGEFFTIQPKANILSVPYLHPLSADAAANKAILRYEIYMRSYLINLFLIKSPFAFTAVGSAIAVRLSTLRKIGGITPMKSGEDFYLLQKLRKMDFIYQWLAEIVNPAARFSDRVFFGTGPAMIKGASGDWSSYPIYHHQLFQELKKNYDLLPMLYQEEVETPFLAFLKKQFNDNDLWTPLRKNSPTIEQFTKAFHEKADALRILQYIKWEQRRQEITDEAALRSNFSYFFGDIPTFIKQSFCFSELSVEALEELRMKLFHYEIQLRQQHDKKLLVHR